MNSFSFPRLPKLLKRWLFSGSLVWFDALSLSAQSPQSFDLQSGDRVAFVGDTLIEREQTYGYLEQMLTVRHPERDVLFRNLGWSADTPSGVSRASFDFDKPGRGIELLKEEIAAVQPTVVFVGYGMANSFQGEAGLAQFKTELSRLLEAIPAICTNQPVRIVLLSPIRHENLGAPLPDPEPHNRQLELYAKAIAQIAADRNIPFISLYDAPLISAAKTHPLRPLTDNGIHLNADGYSRLASVVEQGLGWGANRRRMEITAEGRIGQGSQGAQITGLEAGGEHARFSALDDRLVSPVLPGNHDGISSADASCLIQIGGLKPGRYELKVDGAPVTEATDKEWQAGVAIERGPQFEQAGELRQAILKKNELYFDRWRPQNETYLFGFRKYEQGKNAVEIPMFDPLIREQEANIARLRRPVAHDYELVPVSGKTLLAGQGQNASQHSAGDSGFPPPKHEQTLPEFEIAPGFEINLYAESPLLAKPTQMNFDPRGRLWVVSSSVYPQVQPGQTADDKVLVLEDTKGVGKVDKSTVFADGLLIPTGVEPGDGGVYVGQSTQLLFFKDNDGDGKADEKRVVLSGFGTEDTHHIVHTLRWGPDGQLYFDQSIYIHSHFETPNGVVRLNSGGVWHLRPPTMELGVFLRGFCNPWGHQFDEFGQSFVTDGAGGQGLSYGMPGATYNTYASMRRELASVSAGSYPKFCSLEIINSRQFPDDWQGNAITCDFRAHRVVRFAIEEKDSAYATREMPDLLRTTNVTFRPIDVKLGPDGALYIADWSNPIIQHGEVDFRDPRRDHEHGRIWRVTATGRPLLERPQLVNAANRDLLNQLLSPNRYNQEQARRVLTERGPVIAPDLADWVKSQSDEKAGLQALWMYQSINVVEPALLEKVLSARDGRVRAAATRVVSYWHAHLPNALELLAARIADDFPRVRIEAMRALAEIPTARSAELVLTTLDKPLDPFLDYAAWLSINDLAQPWVAAVQSGEWKPDGREKQLEFALKAIEPALAGVVLDRVLQNRSIARDGGGPWIELIGQAGGEKDLRRLLDLILSDGLDPAAEARALTALSEAARLRNARPPGDLDAVSALFKSTDAKVQADALRLAGNWKREGLVPQILPFAGDHDSPPGLHRAAFESLREIGGPAVIAGILPLTAKPHEGAVRREAVLALVALDLDQARQPAIETLNDLKSESEALAFWRSLLSVKGAAAALAKSLPKTGLPPLMAKAGLRVAREGGRNETDLVLALERGADLESEGLGLTDAEMKQLAARALREGDPARGEMVFRRKEIGCVTCHAIGGVGGKVGPDLTSIGASAQADYLIESVFYPNRKIKEGFHSTLIETRDGEELSGILVRETGEQLVLRDVTDKEISIAKNNIKTRAQGNSLMPSGLVDSLTPAQQLDLFRFLTELGKPGAYDASRGNIARSWKLLPATLEVAQFGDDKVLDGKITDSRWSAANSLVDGRLLRGQLRASLDAVRNRDPRSIYVAAQFQVARTGAVAFHFSGASGSAIWVDGRPANRELKTELSAGTHTIITKLDANNLPDSLRLESADVTFLVN